MSRHSIFSSRTFSSEFFLILVIISLINSSFGKPSSILSSNRKYGHHFPQYFEPHLHSPKNSIKGTPIWNSYYIPVNERSDKIQEGYGFGPNHEIDTHHSHQAEHGTQQLVKVLHEFIGVMGPFLFPWPYFFAMLPLAIPAIPLALWFDRTNGAEGNHSPEHSPTHNVTNTTEHHTENSHIIASTTLTPMTLKPLTTLTTTKLTTKRPTTIKPTIQTTTTTTPANPPIMSSTNFTIISNSSHTTTGDVPLDPPTPIEFPQQTPPLYPFPLFLNSSFLAIDYNGDQYWEHKSN